MWGSFVELIRLVVLAAAHLCGGSVGFGIVDVSIVVRLAMLPLTLRLARQARERQAKLATLEPELAVLRRRFATQPARLLAETRKLHATQGIRDLTPSNILSSLIQAPLLGGLYAAVRGGLGARVRFLWIADLADSNGALLGLVALATAAAAAASVPHDRATSAALIGPAIVNAVATIVFFWSASSAVLLSVGAGSIVSGAQALVLALEKSRSGQKNG